MQYVSEIVPTTYTVYRKDRTDGYGGVLIAIKSIINHEILDSDPRLEAQFLKVSTVDKTPLIIASVYRPPNRDIEYMELMCNTIESIVINNRNAVLWIGGDLNLPDIVWPSCSVTGKQYPHSLSERFLEMLNTCGLEQIVREPTRQNRTLDLFLTNRPTLVNRCSTIPGLGDHEAVCTDTSVKANIARPVKRKILLWNKANQSDLESDCKAFQQNFLKDYNTDSPVNLIWNCIKNNLISLMDKHIPTKVASSRHNQPWITSELKRLTRRKKRSYNKQKGKPKNSYEHKRYLKLKRHTGKRMQSSA